MKMLTIRKYLSFNSPVKVDDRHTYTPKVHTEDVKFIHRILILLPYKNTPPPYRTLTISRKMPPRRDKTIENKYYYVLIS